MLLGDDLVEARFIRRVNRFLAVVELNGCEEGVHVANSGRLQELFLPGAPLLLKPAARHGRKTSYDLALVEAAGILVSADARLPNALVAEAAAAGTLDGIGAPSAIVRESTFGESRFDLMLEHENGRQYVEVKSVTLVENGVGLFPDSPTLRGAKHLDTLAEAVRAGHLAAVVFVVQRADATAFAANEPADPGSGRSIASCRCRGGGSLRLQLPRNPQRSAPRPSAADNSLRVHTQRRGRTVVTSPIASPQDDCKVAVCCLSF